MSRSFINTSREINVQPQMIVVRWKEVFVQVKSVFWNGGGVHYFTAAGQLVFILKQGAEICQ